MAQTLQLNVSRHSTMSPWGIRLHGGREYMSPITIQRVADESPAYAAGLRAGDVLVAINGHDVSNAAQGEAQRLIAGAGNVFNLTIARGGLYTKIATPHHSSSSSAPGGKKHSESPYQVLADPNPRGQTFSTVAKPPVQSQQYNNPSKLYSDSTIREVMDKHSEPLAQGVKGVNFKKPGNNKEEKQDNLANSGALQMLRELEASGGKLEPLKPAFKTVHVAAPHHLQQPSQSPAMTKIAKGPVSQASAQWEKMATNDNESFNNDYSNKASSMPKAPTFNPGTQPNQTFSYQAPKSNVGAPRPVSGGNWQQTLDSNKAGAASNAADFTKQFMSDLYGKSDAPNPPMAAPMAPVTAPKAPMMAPKAPMAPMNPVSAPMAPMNPVSAPMAQLNPVSAPKAPESGPNLHWERTLGANKAGSASNAADFTKQFMSDMYSKPAECAPKTSGHVVFKPNPPAPAQSGNWTQTLDSNKAGAASNAADFTKQFMSDFYGPGGNSSSYSSQATSNITNQSFKTSTVSHSEGSKHSSSQSLASASDKLKSALPSVSVQLGPNQVLITPKRGKGVLQHAIKGRVPQCGCGCEQVIRGPFVTAAGKNWWPGHFKCDRNDCGLNLQETGFVEEKGHLYCEQCFVNHLAPSCSKCRRRIGGPCLKALHKFFHPECFVCAHCSRIFANAPFYLEDDLPYCERDWHELFTTKCANCGFPIEAGDKWVEAIGNNFHSQCFNCMLCKRNLEGAGFFVKAGKPFCKEHASRGF